MRSRAAPPVSGPPDPLEDEPKTPELEPTAPVGKLNAGSPGSGNVA